jgi:hypothetical protein
LVGAPPALLRLAAVFLGGPPAATRQDKTRQAAAIVWYRMSVH